MTGEAKKLRGPTPPDGERAEVPEVRIHGFTAAHDERSAHQGL